MKQEKKVRKTKRKLTPEEIKIKKKKIKKRFFICLSILLLLIVAYIANDFIIFE